MSFLKNELRNYYIGFICLFIVYIVWGSTYLAIRVAVREGSGFPPLYMGGSRLVIAGLIILLISSLSKQRIRPSYVDLLYSAILGFLLWTIGNGTIVVAEKSVSSGYAALIANGSTPLITAILESFYLKRRLSLSLIIWLVVGVIGLLVLTINDLKMDCVVDFYSTLLLVIGSLCWSIGAIYQKKWFPKISVSILASSGYQQLFGGLWFIFFAIIAGEPCPNPILPSIYAWIYLIIFGSVIGFTSYVMAIKILPLSVAVTYSYVNPVIAVILGWLILSEKISLLMIMGIILILVSIYGVFNSRIKIVALNK